MNTPNNARSILSKSKIKQAFVNLLESKNLSDITIGNICDKAGINRTTFYAHFSSLTDLFKALESELYSVSPSEFDGECSDVTLYSASTAYEECNYVALEVKRLLREEGYRCRDIAVISRSEDEYSKSLFCMSSP